MVLMVLIADNISSGISFNVSMFVVLATYVWNLSSNVFSADFAKLANDLDRISFCSLGNDCILGMLGVSIIAVSVVFCIFCFYFVGCFMCLFVFVATVFTSC